MESYSPLARTVCVTNKNITSLNICDEPPEFIIPFPGIPTSPRPTTIPTTTPSVSWSIPPERTTTPRSLPPGVTLSTTILSTLSKFTTTDTTTINSPPNTPDEKQLSTVAIVIIIIFCIFVFAAIISFVTWYIWDKWKCKPKCFLKCCKVTKSGSELEIKHEDANNSDKIPLKDVETPNGGNANPGMGSDGDGGVDGEDQKSASGTCITSNGNGSINTETNSDSTDKGGGEKHTPSNTTRNDDTISKVTKKKYVSKEGGGDQDHILPNADKSNLSNHQNII